VSRTARTVDLEDLTPPICDTCGRPIEAIRPQWPLSMTRVMSEYETGSVERDGMRGSERGGELLRSVPVAEHQRGGVREE